MGKPALEEILAIEKEIQAQIEEERRKTGEWLEQQREAIARESDAGIAACRQKCNLVISEAEEETRREVAERVREAEQYEALLRELPDNKLELYVKKYLPLILPESEL